MENLCRNNVACFQRIIRSVTDDDIRGFYLSPEWWLLDKTEAPVLKITAAAEYVRRYAESQAYPDFVDNITDALIHDFVSRQRGIR